MMQNNTTIFESLFDRNFSDKSNVDFLQEMTALHPYFTPAQFYLLQQTASGTETFEKQALKTNLLFNNAHWLNFQLTQTVKPFITKQVIEVESKPVEIVDVVTESIEKAEPVFAEPEITALPQTEVAEKNIPSIEENEKAEHEFEPALEVTELVISEPIIEHTSIPKTVAKKIPEEIKASFSGEMEELPDNTDADNTDAAEETETNPDIEPMKIELKMPEDKGDLQDEMIFEPMHLVDYFASQGIKISDETLTADKLGKQLKSFTAWLKTMKKVHLEEDGNTAQTDHQVNKMAEISNAKAEILTEAMAEVLAKQGKLDKAGELYQKLSLLNPAKSTYFAAKIENLKEI